MIDRPVYLSGLLRWKDKNGLVKIVTGARRCGKSTLFALFQNRLRQDGVSDDRILHINLELANNAKLLDWQTLHNHVEANLAESGTTYVFLDEIQTVADFQRAVNSLRLNPKIDLYLTGSNAYMFSNELSTLISGRYIEIKMLPLSFKEFLSAFHSTPEPLDRLFDRYVTFGSFPQTLYFYDRNNETIDAVQWNDYMDSLYSTVIVKDVLSRQGIKEPEKLRRIVRFMFANVGNETSLNNISNTLSRENDAKSGKIHAQTIEKYLECLLDAHVLYKAQPHFLKGKELLRSNAKYYAVDIGLRHYLIGSADAGAVLENIVYLELLRRGYKVETGKIGNREVDFVATRAGGELEYYQVSQSVIDQETLKRELASLQAVNDNYPKYLLTRDYSTANYEGIRHLNVLQWLAEKDEARAS